MPFYDLQRIRQIPIESVAKRLGLHVSRGRCLCPFHDDSRPSLTFRRGHNSFHCFVCGEGGSGPIDLVMKVLGKNFREACQWLSEEHHIDTSWQDNRLWQRKKPSTESLCCRQPPVVDLPYLESLAAHPVLHDPAQAFLFKERHISPAVVRLLGISSIERPVPMSRNLHGGFFNAPSLLIPYRDMEGRLLSVQARYLGTATSAATDKGSETREMPRFQFPRGSRCCIFNLPVLKQLAEGASLFITEGVTDCMAMLSSGRKAIAIPSATLLKSADIAELHTALTALHSVPHIVPDRDLPGERLYLDLKEHFPQLVRHQLPEGYKDFGQWWASRSP